MCFTSVESIGEYTLNDVDFGVEMLDLPPTCQTDSSAVGRCFTSVFLDNDSGLQIVHLQACHTANFFFGLNNFHNFLCQ